MLKRFIILFTISIVTINLSMAVEGMWLPILLEKYNMEEMQQKGFKLTAQDIYDINQASIKDAVVGLVRLSSPFHHFCTGEVVSPEGLIITNHHCGYRAIQSHSTVDNDLLTNGFWAMNKKEELTNEGIGVCFLKRMEDVTQKVNSGITADMEKKVRDSVLNANIRNIEEQAVEGTHYLAKVKPFFGGNEYYLSVYEIFRDLRLVAAPPSAIGKFGGDTDNWMWPRHTGDFSMFRIYAGKDNKPADISDDNVPYQPKKHLEISLNGIKKGDFTMVMGYPGTTEQFLPSYAVQQTMELINPIRIKVRSKAIDIMKAGMNSDPSVRIKYSAKVAGIANGWKKWIGENRGLERMNALERKRDLEKDFTTWVNQDPARKKEYGHILDRYKEIYIQTTPYQKTVHYFFEAILGAELVDFSGDFRKLMAMKKDSDQEDIDKAIASLKTKTEKFFKDYHRPTDIKLFEALMGMYYHNVDKEYHPAIFEDIAKKHDNSLKEFTDWVYKKSMFSNAEDIIKFLDNYSPKKNKKLSKDPVFSIFTQSLNIYFSKLYPELNKPKQELTELDQLYIKGLREFKSNEVFYPDANSTFRIAYGNIDDYEPRDAVKYYHYTTLTGIMEKDNPEIYDYDVPDKLKALYRDKDFGDYANADGTLPVCFTASNHTTGGNSGSPVINAHGQLIGINFDRNWEGTMSDIMYDPDMCRNITLDVRYILFLIDKFAGASHLVEEMTLVKTPPQESKTEPTTTEEQPVIME